MLSLWSEGREVDTVPAFVNLPKMRTARCVMHFTHIA